MSIPPWVSVLGKVILGPPPSRESEVTALVRQHNVTSFVDLRPRDSKQVKGWVQQPSNYVRVPFTLKEATGKKKQDRKRSLVHMYMYHASLIDKAIPQEESVYLFSKSGFHEEVFIGMSLWYMRGGTLPKELTSWIGEQNFTYWLDEDIDQIELLGLLLDELGKSKEGLRAFYTPIVKK